MPSWGGGRSLPVPHRGSCAQDRVGGLQDELGVSGSTGSENELMWLGLALPLPPGSPGLGTLLGLFWVQGAILKHLLQQGKVA